MALSATSQETRYRDVLEFWFGTVPATDLPSKAIRTRWFETDPNFDESIRGRFGPWVELALDGGLRAWEPVPRGRLALVLLLDQFTRNLFRGSGRAFAGDARALRLASGAVETGLDHELTLCERSFLYLPFEHAEDAKSQEQALSRFRSLVSEATPECRGHYRRTLEFAERHKVVIDRFGRFPHRNEVLGRRSTPAERAHLEKTPGGF